jgi:hypothetical protein
LATRIKGDRTRAGNGVVAEAEFDVTSPILDQQLEQFAIKAEGLLKKRGLKAFAATHKRDGNKLHVVLFPASPEKGSVAELTAESIHDTSASGVLDAVSRAVDRKAPQVPSAPGLAGGLKPSGGTGFGVRPGGRRPR